jgi:antitoxin MazE
MATTIGSKKKTVGKARPATAKPGPTAPRGVRNGKVARWGNSLAFRIPREVAERLKLKAGESVDIAVAGRTITIKPSAPARRKWSEAELLKGVTPAAVGGEIDWGDPVGDEVW